jgi:hypothetical protein
MNGWAIFGIVIGSIAALLVLGYILAALFYIWMLKSWHD